MSRFKARAFCDRSSLRAFIQEGVEATTMLDLKRSAAMTAAAEMHAPEIRFLFYPARDELTVQQRRGRASW